MHSTTNSTSSHSKERYSVGVIGLGAVGKSAVRELTNIPEIQRFYLFTSEQKNVSICRDNCGKPRHIDFLGRELSQLHEELDNIDIMLLTANQSPYKQTKLSREDELRYNLEIIKRAGHELRGFGGSVVVVTNPVDINAYLLSGWSGIPPEHITGLNHIDLARWRNIISDVFASHIDQDSLSQLNVYTIGPHSNEAVAIFGNYGGLSQNDIAFLTKQNLEKLRQELIRYPLRQFKNGQKDGKATEDLAADSLREVVEAMITGESTVCQSTFMRPDELGIEGVLPGLFFGYPIRFDESGRAVPHLQTVDDMSDIALIKKAYHNLENVLLNLERAGQLPRRITHQALPTPSPAVISHRQPHPAPDYFGLEAEIIASADNRLFRWDNPRSPNKREETDFPYRIEALELLAQNSEKYLLLGAIGGISVVNLALKQQQFLRADPGTPIRRIATATLDGKNYIYAATKEKIYLFEPARSGKPIAELAGFSGIINNISADGEWLIVSADRLYLHTLRDPTLSHKLSIGETGRQKIDDAHLLGNELVAAIGPKVIRFNVADPEISLKSCRPELHGINSLTPTSYLGGTLFVAALDPVIYRIDQETLEVDRAPFTKSDKNPNGTGKIVYLEQGSSDYILAADKTSYMSPKNPGITLWNLIAKDLPRFFPINAEHSIRGLVVI